MGGSRIRTMKRFEEMTMEELKKIYNEKLKLIKEFVDTVSEDNFKKYILEVE